MIILSNYDNPPGNPHYISFLKLIYPWPVIHPVVSDQGHYTFLYRYTKHNREGGRKNKRTNTALGQLQAPKKGEVYVTLLCCSPCICRLSRACILRETSTKPLTILTSSRVGKPGLCESTGLSSRLSDFC